MGFKSTDPEDEMDQFREEWAVFLRADPLEMEPQRGECMEGVHPTIEPSVRNVRGPGIELLIRLTGYKDRALAADFQA